MRNVYYVILIITTLLLGAGCHKNCDCDCKQPQAPEQPEIPIVKETYAIGDHYKKDGVEGIVYKVTEDGKHGMIFSMDEGKNMFWSYDLNLTGSADPQNGKNNFDLIKTMRNWGRMFPAFRWCEDHNLDVQRSWYLPSAEEWREIATVFSGGEIYDSEAQYAFNQKIIAAGAVPLRNNLEDGKYAAYWTSCERNPLEAIAVRPLEGGGDKAFALQKKDHYAYVRAVRPF